MSTVSTSFELDYSVRKLVTTSGSAAKYDVRSRVTNSYFIKYRTRKTIYPAKVFALKYSIRSRVLRSESIKYGVRISIAGANDGGAFSDAFSGDFDSAASSGGSPGKVARLVYDVRSRTTQSASIQYDVAAIASSTVSKQFSILYNTLVTPGTDRIMATPIEFDAVPPQMVTTSSF